jgi:hypothetical protein
MKNSMVIAHEQEVLTRVPKVGQLRTNFGSPFMNFGAMDN